MKSMTNPSPALRLSDETLERLIQAVVDHTEVSLESGELRMHKAAIKADMLATLTQAPEPSEGRDLLAPVSMLRAAIENERRQWFCSGPDCEPFDHGRDDGFELALAAFDKERSRQIEQRLSIAALSSISKGEA